MILGTLGASLLGNFLSGKGLCRSGEGLYRSGQGITKKSCNATTSFNKF